MNAVDNDDGSKKWHKKLKLMSQTGIDHLEKKNLLPGIKGIPSKSCVDCLAGK